MSSPAASTTIDVREYNQVSTELLPISGSLNARNVRIENSSTSESLRRVCFSYTMSICGVSMIGLITYLSSKSFNDSLIVWGAGAGVSTLIHTIGCCYFKRR